MMKLQPQKRYIEPGDQETFVDIHFNLAELKQLQNLLVRAMERAAEEENAVYEDQRQLALKLEYLLSDQEKTSNLF